MDRLLSSNSSRNELYIDRALDSTSIAPIFSKHAKSAAQIAEGVGDNYSLSNLGFLNLSPVEKRNLGISFKNNLVLQSEILDHSNFPKRKRYADRYRSPLLKEFPDRGLMKSALYAAMKLRAENPDSAYFAQISQSYLEYAFFAYGVYFETGGKRVLSLTSFENLLEGFDQSGVEFTDGLKLYKLQTFIEKTAEGISPFYNSERLLFESKYDYSEDDFRAIPSERIFPMVKHDPEDWKAALLPLKYDKTCAEQFRMVAREFIRTRPEITNEISEKEFFRFQNVSCAKSTNPKEGSKLRVEVRSKYEMTKEPFQFKRTLINVSTSNYRDSWVNTPESRKTLKYYEILARRMIKNVPEIPDGDMENDGYVNSLRSSPGMTYVMGDIKKWGITFPIYLLRIFCEEAEDRFPFGWVDLARQYENSVLHVGDRVVKVGIRGFGLGNLNYISSIIHYLILKMTNCEKFIVRSDDSLTVFRSDQNPWYEIYLKEKLGFIVNRKKINISTKANVFCENYTEVECKFQSQLYEKLGYMTGQLAQALRKVCNPASCKFYLQQASSLPLPAKSLLDLMISLTYTIFGPEFDPHEVRLDPECGGWTNKYYLTNLKSEYIAFEKDLETFPENEDLIKTIYKAKLRPEAPGYQGSKPKEYYPLLRDKIFPESQAKKEFMMERDNFIIPIETPFEYVERINCQLAETQRLNKNAFQRQRKWKALQKKRRKRFRICQESLQKNPEEADQILLSRIRENYEEGKGGYAIPSMIFDEPEYDSSARANLIEGTVLSERTYIVNPKEFIDLKKEDELILEFLNSVENRCIRPDKHGFLLWKESKDTLYSMNEYNNGILVNENYREIIADNEHELAVFNIPTEIAYLDWSNRSAQEGTMDFYQTKFKFSLNSEKKLLYSPKMFKRRSVNAGYDPYRIKYFNVDFYVNEEEYKIIKSGLKLMKFRDDCEEELHDLFRQLYNEGLLAPNFLIRREELLQEAYAIEERIRGRVRDPSEDDEVLLEILKWRSEEAERSYELISEIEFDQFCSDQILALEQDTNLFEVDVQEDTAALESLFTEAELRIDEQEVQTDESEFEFEYDYFSD